jgi:PadR family transcriptional regulator
MSRDTLGEFEQLVLLCALRLRDGAYAVSIIEEIERHTGRRPSHGAVFVAVRRLEKKGLVSTTLGDATTDRGGRPPRMVVVERKAIGKLRESREALLSLWADLDVITAEPS